LAGQKAQCIGVGDRTTLYHVLRDRYSGTAINDRAIIPAYFLSQVATVADSCPGRSSQLDIVGDEYLEWVAGGSCVHVGAHADAVRERPSITPRLIDGVKPGLSLNANSVPDHGVERSRGQSP